MCVFVFVCLSTRGCVIISSLRVYPYGKACYHTIVDYSKTETNMEIKYYSLLMIF